MIEREREERERERCCFAVHVCVCVCTCMYIVRSNSARVVLYITVGAQPPTVACKAEAQSEYARDAYTPLHASAQTGMLSR